MVPLISVIKLLYIMNSIGRSDMSFPSSLGGWPDSPPLARDEIGVPEEKLVEFARKSIAENPFPWVGPVPLVALGSVFICSTPCLVGGTVVRPCGSVNSVLARKLDLPSLPVDDMTPFLSMYTTASYRIRHRSSALGTHPSLEPPAKPRKTLRNPL